MAKINLHSHTTYCDGKNTPEEMVLAAMDRGFDVFGFSGHSYTAFDESYCMSRAMTDAYEQEVPPAGFVISAKDHDTVRYRTGYFFRPCGKPLGLRHRLCPRFL